MCNNNNSNNDDNHNNFLLWLKCGLILNAQTVHHLPHPFQFPTECIFEAP